MKRDVLGAPLWVCFGALSQGLQPPRTHYVVNYRPEEAMYIIPQGDLVRRHRRRRHTPAATHPPPHTRRHTPAATLPLHCRRTAAAPLCGLCTLRPSSSTRAAAHASGGGGPHD